MTVADAITQQAKVTVQMNGRRVRGKVSTLNHPANPVLVILLPGGCATTMATQIVMDAIQHKRMLSW